MKFALVLAALLATQNAHAESLKQIFQSIADATEPGNGNGHTVSHQEGFNKKQEMAKLNKEVNKAHPRKEDCRFEIKGNVESALQAIKDDWSSKETASRLSGLNDKGLIKGIVYSEWDRNSGDSEYCSYATMKVFAVDGTLLTFDFNETD